MERHHIDDDLTVTQLLRRWPPAAAVFVRRGMACVGCSMAPFETLAEVASVYGQDPAGFLAELAKASEIEPELGRTSAVATVRPREKRLKGR